MKRLIGFELRKILNRRVIIAILGCLALTVFYFIQTRHSEPNSLLTAYRENPKLVSSHEGPIQPALAKKYEPRLYETSASFYPGPHEEVMKRVLEQEYAGSAYQSDLFKAELNELRKDKRQLESSGETNTFAYKDMQKKLRMLDDVKTPGFYVTDVWRDLIYYIASPPGSLFIGLIMVLALCSLYSGEAGHRMDALILSSRKGRLPIVRAKLLAGLIFTIGWVTVFFGVSVLASCLPYGFLRWDAPLNSLYLYRTSPYDWTLIQGFLLLYAMTLLGACGLCLFTALISASLKSSLSSLGLAAVLVFLPLFSFPGILGKWIAFFSTSIMSNTSLIGSYKSFNVFGYPVLYLPLAIVSSVALAAVALALIPKAFARRLRV
ncbi:ABC transporter permease subunit [Gorillibacterium massiliense]|uniref:ABC transporter permease subunit n=1 Tax=Gorillibacterium massiliense TaxID=1280390 RepID=UPI0004AEC9CB|nr:ABC transporter permease subunit [Gorillibacterium massiliense]